MSNFYDEVEIEDMSFDEKKQLYHFPCPCGDRFEITIAQLKEGDDVARCPSCSLIILVIYDQDDYLSEEEEEEEEAVPLAAQPSAIAV
ncbi:Diphthamide biosynthesis protein 3 [Taphrina deformans PYCC 5710]|uniref:Diphthamide biosynthesis protein 3 n=1 Tax=Taphrina deformans (strain PYCC 5710 / ATCC 11124 / CBS 356.35 / IMI 108563 / JCM 9778 / NBRC 8474) TaxID=1097556 RepID=R4XC11_TAPDE|nr:Diphthamide biosynthesis protein 3 [Taphrina deformans PYCC 5710]|eukprot:CCG83356.1 Diphthamide biosynthesis protein 3 [Taphrina deformans PYCC 5710]